MTSIVWGAIAYCLFGYFCSVIVHAGLTNEWKFFITYDLKEDKLTDEEIEELSNVVILLWPVAVLLLTKDKILKFRTGIAKRFERKKK